MTDVLYIHPLGQNPSFSLKYFKKKTAADHFFGFIPVGAIGAINNLVKNGISVKGVNFSLKKRVNPSFDLISCLNFYKPKIVLIDMHWYVHIKNGLEIAKTCKKTLDCKVIVGGMSATLFYIQLLKTKYIDYIIKGDAEKPALELVKSIISGSENSKIPNISSKEFDNKIGYCATDIDNYDYVSLDFLEDSDSYINMFDSWVMTGKGCPFDCKNCDGARNETPELFGRNKTIFRKADVLIKELKKIKSETVGFSLDLELLPNKVINALSKQHFNLNLRNEFFQLAGIDTLRKVRKTFNSFDFVFSPVSGDDKERKEYGKNFTNKEFLEMLEKIEKEDFNSGVIIYFTDYMISPLGAKKLNEKARNELIKKIEKIVPYAIIFVLPQVVDPGALKGKMKIDEIFEYYSS